MHVEIDEERKLLYRISGSDRERIALGPLRGTALRLLYYLYDRGCESPGQPVPCTREELVRAVWEDNPPGHRSQALRQLVQRIRRTIEPSRDRFVYLRTQETGGYYLYSAPFVQPSEQPFTLHPVHTPERFFGRYGLLEHVFELWGNFSPLNFLVQGLPRSGKTSLLLFLRRITRTPPYLLRPRQQAELLIPALNARFVYVHLNLPTQGRPQAVQKEILSGLGLEVQGSGDLGTFRDRIVDHFRGTGIILFDEMHRAYDDPGMTDLWLTLRWLAGRPIDRGAVLGFAFTWDANVPLERLDRQTVSPFFNLFPNRFELGPFPEAEARDLIDSSPMPFAEPDRLWILEQSRGWPALLQVLCSERLRSLRRGNASDSWKRRAVERSAELRAVLRV